jgi:hypothetical protein
MSSATTASVSTPRSLDVNEMRASGFERGGPEIDYGMRWGERGDVRVSCAPYQGRDHGFVYADDPVANRCLILAAHTTPAQIEGVWHDLVNNTSSPDA